MTLRRKVSTDNNLWPAFHHHRNIS